MMLKYFSFLTAATVIGLLALAPSSAIAKEAGDIMVRLRGIILAPDASGTTDAIGGSAHVGSDVVPELDFSYFFTQNIAAELILATTRNSVTVRNSTIGTAQLGRVSLLPPTLNLQYHFMPKDRFSPYVGAGLNYTFFYNEKNGSSITSINYKNGIGYSFQAGLDIQMKDRWYLNFDLKKIFLETDITANGGTINARNVDLDPWIFGIGVGYSF